MRGRREKSRLFCFSPKRRRCNIPQRRVSTPRDMNVNVKFGISQCRRHDTTQRRA